MNDTDERSCASRGSHGDSLPVLRSLIDGVRGMGLGDPGCGDRIEASDVVRWAVSEIERLRLTDEEREAVEGMVSDYQEIAEFNEERCHPRYAEKARRRAAMLIGLLERLG